MGKELKIKAYYIKGCKIDFKTIFSGYVLNIDDEPITESIKRKTGANALLCEVTNEGFDYDRVKLYSVPVTELSAGDIMMLSGNFSALYECTNA